MFMNLKKTNFNMNFGEAIKLLKAGKLVTRKGWNGKEMFLFSRPEDVLPDHIVTGAVSIPKSVKRYFEKKWLGKPIANNFVKVTSYICMKAADDTIVNGWLASQTDIMAEDWEEFKIEE
jgi:hypothetical protein